MYMYLATYVRVNLPRTTCNLQDRLATIKFIATGHAGTTQAMQEHRPSINSNKLYMRGAPFSIKKRQHTSVAGHISCMQGMK